MIIDWQFYYNKSAATYRDHIHNDAVRDRIRQAIGPYDDILTMVKKHKLKWFKVVFQDQQGLPRKFYKEQCKLRREKKGPTKEALGE